MAEVARNAGQRRTTVVIREEEIQRYYSGLIKDAAGMPLLNDQADINAYLQPQTLGTIFYYDKNGDILPLEWKEQIDVYIKIWNTSTSVESRIAAIKERLNALTEFAQKLIEFGRVVSKGASSFNATVSGISTVFGLVNKGFGTFSKVFFTALSWQQKQTDALLLSKIVKALKRLDLEAKGLNTKLAQENANLSDDNQEIASNFKEYERTNTLNPVIDGRNATTEASKPFLLIVGFLIAIGLFKKQ